MKEQKKDFRLGQILINFGYIDNEQLEKALNVKKIEKNKLIGQITIELGFCTEKQIDKALLEQKKEARIGQILIRSCVITEDQLNECIGIQEKKGGLLGFILVSKKYCTSADIVNALREQSIILHKLPN